MTKQRVLPWIRAWPTGSDVIVWLDVAKADKAWSRDELYIPKGAPEHLPKYERFGDWLSVAGQPVEMPHVTLRYWTLHFTDGRHRFAWLRDQGAKAIPVSTDPEVRARTERVLGTDLRETIVGNLRLVQTPT